MNNCKNCGAELLPGVKFCSACGTAFKPPAKITCEKCGSEVPDGFIFCTSCGTRTKTVTEAVPAPVPAPVPVPAPAAVPAPVRTIPVKKTSPAVIAIIIIFAVILFIAAGAFFIYYLNASYEDDYNYSYNDNSGYSNNNDYNNYNEQKSYPDFTLHNNTGIDIYYIYVSPSFSENWEENILEGVLYDGEKINISFPSEYDDIRYYDIRVMDNDGGYAEWTEIDLLSINNFYVYTDETGSRAYWD